MGPMGLLLSSEMFKNKPTHWTTVSTEPFCLAYSSSRHPCFAFEAALAAPTCSFALILSFVKGFEMLEWAESGLPPPDFSHESGTCWFKLFPSYIGF